MKKRLPLYHVTWELTDPEGVYVRARDKRDAERKYKALASNDGDDEAMLECWPSIRNDLTVNYCHHEGGSFAQLSL